MKIEHHGALDVRFGPANREPFITGPGTIRAQVPPYGQRFADWRRAMRHS
jgi:hypothetical protein